MKKGLKQRKQMTLYTISNLIAGFGSQTYAFAISFYILQTTGSSLSFALQLICNVVPRSIAGPFIGELVDRFSKRKIIIISQLSSLVVVFGLAIYMYMFGLHLVAIYVATALLSVTASFTSIAFSAAITELFSEDYIQKASSMNQVAISSAAIASPIIGGIVYGFLPLYGMLFIFVGLFLFAVLLNTQLVFSKKQTKVESPQHQSLLTNIKIGFEYTKNHPFAMRILIIALLINFVFAAFEIGYSYTLIHQFKIPAASFGITESGFAFGMLGVSILLAIIPTIKRPMQRTKLCLFSTGFVMLSVVIPYFIPFSMTVLVIYYFSIMFLLGVAITSTNTIIFTVFQRSIDDQMKGRFFGLLETFAMAISPISFVLFGILFDYLNAPLLLAGISIVVIVMIIFLIPSPLINKIDSHLKQEDAQQVNESVLDLYEEIGGHVIR